VDLAGERGLQADVLQELYPAPPKHRKVQHDGHRYKRGEIAISGNQIGEKENDG
jgi:hypothetical protein